MFLYLLLWAGGEEANFQLKVGLDKMTKFLRGRHRGVESTLLLKHLPGEALGKSNQGSFQTEGLRAFGLSPREGPAEAAGQQGFQRVPTGWTPGPSGCRESGEQSGAAFSLGEQEGRRPAGSSAGGRARSALHQVTPVKRLRACGAIPGRGALPSETLNQAFTPPHLLLNSSKEHV